MMSCVLFVSVSLILVPLTSAICPSNADSVFYNVTLSPANINSHSGYESGSNYPATATITCIFISTATSGKVIKLKQEAFELEESKDCTEDYLIIYNGDTVTHKKEDQLGSYCGSIGPDEAYSSQQYMTLYFYTDRGGSGRGFQFEASSINEDDVPSSLSTAAIVLICAVCVAVVALIVGIVLYVVWKKKQNKEDDVDEFEEEEDEGEQAAGNDTADGNNSKKKEAPIETSSM